MRVVSLFDGISGAMLALDNIGLTVDKYFASEIDEKSVSISKKNWGNRITHIGDVCSVHPSDLGDVDLLIGGSPCTNLSIAGDGSGLEGKDSSLFFEYVRILQACNPKYFLLENVNSMRNDDRAAMSAYLGSIRCGRMIMIDSSCLTAQCRKRLYWTNIPFRGIPTNIGIQIKDVLEQDVDSSLFLNTSQTITPTKNYLLKQWNNLDRMVKIFDIGSGRQGERIYSIYGKSVNLTSSGGGPGGKTGMYMVDGYNGPHDKDSVMPNCRRLTPVEAERLQGIRDNYTSFYEDGRKMAASHRYKMLGNGFTIPVVMRLLSPLRELV